MKHLDFILTSYLLLYLILMKTMFTFQRSRDELKGTKTLLAIIAKYGLPISERPLLYQALLRCL